MANTKKSFWSTPSGWAAIGLIAAASYFLFFEHGEHVFPFLPYLILLLCPFMHMFMHGSHGHHGHASKQDEPQKEGHGRMTFSEKSQQNEAYKDGYIAGLDAAREEQEHKGMPKEKDDAR